MSWLLRSLLLCAAALIGSSCGETGDSMAGVAASELTVLIPSGETAALGLGSLVTAVDYAIECESQVAEGALTHAGSFEAGVKGTTAVWKGSLSNPAESCEITFVARDGYDELICTWTEPLPAASDWPSELFIELPCYRFSNCTSTPLPSTARKNSFCISVVGVLLSVQTPASIDRVQRIEYVISEVWDPGAFVDNPEIVERYRGELSPAGSGQIDFGAGPVPTDRWEAAIEEVPAHAEYLIALTALDSEDGPVCAVERQLGIVAGAVAQIEVAIPCLEPMESQP
jgi:hypothetical protein